MRAQCCICADLFEGTQTVNISATPCGHVFHEACLMRWMDTSSTCPSCRTHIKKTQLVKRLFFDISEEVDGDEDVSHFKNQVSDLKAQVREKAKLVREVEESRDNYQALLAVAEAKHEEVSTKLSREVSMREVLKADLKRVQKENDWHVQEIRELQKKADKLHELQSVETILKGSSSDAEEMLRQYSDGGDSSIRQLSSLVTVMKREYNQVLADKRTAKEQLSKLRQQIGSYQSEAKHAKKEVTSLRLELQITNKSLSEKEKENDENRRRIVHLRKALRHNKTEGSQSFIAALTEDSPNVAYSPVPNLSDTPTSSKLESSVAEMDCENKTSSPTKKSCVSPDLFVDTPVKKKSKVKAEEQDGDDHPISKRPRLPKAEITSSSADTDADAEMTPQEGPHEADDDGPNIPPAMMSILQSKLNSRSNSHQPKSSHHSGSVITRGFDGFGGSTTFVHPQGPPRGSFMKLAQQKKKLGSSGVKKNANIQRLTVPKCQRPIKDCISAVPASAAAKSSGSSFSLASSSLSSESVSSSSSFSAPSSTESPKKPLSLLPASIGNVKKSSSSKLSSSVGNMKKFLSSSTLGTSSSKVLPSSSQSSAPSSKFSSSSKLGMFVSKGPSLSGSKDNNDFIDLT